jgi:hypothetical protein
MRQQQQHQHAGSRGLLQFAAKMLGSMALLAVAAGVSARPSYAAPMRRVPVLLQGHSWCIFYTQQPVALHHVPLAKLNSGIHWLNAAAVPGLSADNVTRQSASTVASCCSLDVLVWPKVELLFTFCLSATRLLQALLAH